mgnify:CR=1 FL=1
MKTLLSTLLVLGFVAFAAMATAHTWTSMNLPEMSGKWVFTGITFPSPNSGWAAGYVDESTSTKAISKGFVMQFKDGNWKLSEFASPSDNFTFHGIWFLSENEGWAFGQDNAKGLLMLYKNGNWEKVDLSIVKATEWKLYDVFFLSNGEGWAVGGCDGKEKPVLLHFSAGAWKQEDSKEFGKQTIMAVSAINADNVYIGGFRDGEWGLTGMNRANGSFILSKAGDEWEPAKLPLLSKNVICRDIICLDANNVYGVGWMPAFQNAPETGKVLFFNGKKWTELSVENTPKEWNLMSVAFESPGKGWAVGFSDNKGLLVEINKDKWAALGKKSEPAVSDKWLLRSITCDGAGNYYAAGGDSKSNKGVILKLAK